MANNKQFRIRRALVRTLYDYRCGQDLQTVLCSPEILLENPSAEAAFSEWSVLIESGLLIPLPGYGHSVCTLSPEIRRDMDARHGALPPHPVLFGHKVIG